MQLYIWNFLVFYDRHSLSFYFTLSSDTLIVVVGTFFFQTILNNYFSP